MSTLVPGLLVIFRLFESFCIGQIGHHQHIKGNIGMPSSWPTLVQLGKLLPLHILFPYMVISSHFSPQVTQHWLIFLVFLFYCVFSWPRALAARVYCVIKYYQLEIKTIYLYTGELGYDGPLYYRFSHMTDNMLGPSPMHIKYLS